MATRWPPNYGYQWNRWGKAPSEKKSTVATGSGEWGRSPSFSWVVCGWIWVMDFHMGGELVGGTGFLIFQPQPWRTVIKWLGLHMIASVVCCIPMLTLQDRACSPPEPAARQYMVAEVSPISDTYLSAVLAVLVCVEICEGSKNRRPAGASTWKDVAAGCPVDFGWWGTVCVATVLGLKAGYVALHLTFVHDVKKTMHGSWSDCSPVITGHLSSGYLIAQLEYMNHPWLPAPNCVGDLDDRF
jgi:hypothetical protein